MIRNNSKNAFITRKGELNLILKEVDSHLEKYLLLIKDEYEEIFIDVVTHPEKHSVPVSKTCDTDKLTALYKLGHLIDIDTNKKYKSYIESHWLCVAMKEYFKRNSENFKKALEEAKIAYDIMLNKYQPLSSEVLIAFSDYVCKNDIEELFFKSYYKLTLVEEFLHVRNYVK